jgi:hypothetical protein
MGWIIGEEEHRKRGRELALSALTAALDEDLIDTAAMDLAIDEMRALPSLRDAAEVSLLSIAVTMVERLADELDVDRFDLLREIFPDDE